jgi:ATP-dependent protease ClpP protease subunit
MAKRAWFRFDNVAGDPTTVDISILDIIGDWLDEYLWPGGGPGVITAKTFVDQLAQLPEPVKTIRLHVNSPGGDVFAAVTMANALRDQRLTKGRTIDVLIDGLAASAASIIIMAGNTIRIGDNALVMVHNPSSIGLGNAAEMRKIADELDKVRNTIVATYQWQSKLDAAAIVALLDAETWMDADEAIANGFATEKVEGFKAAAVLDRRAVAKLAVPDKYRARVDALLAPAAAEPPAPVAAAAADVLRLCREGGCLDQAETLIAASATVEQVQTSVRDQRAAREAAAVREREIRALCDQAHLPELAGGYLEGAMPLAAIRAQLTVVTAKVDGVEIDGSLRPDHGTKRTARINASAVYAERN